MSKQRLKDLEIEIRKIEDAHSYDTQFQFLRDKDLSGIDFSGQDLTGSNFMNCNLDNANFSGSILEYSNFHGASMHNIIVDRNTKAYGCPHIENIIEPSLYNLMDHNELPYQEILRNKFIEQADLNFGINTRQALLDGVLLVTDFNLKLFSKESNESIENWIDSGVYTAIFGGSPEIEDIANIYEYINLKPISKLEDILNEYMQSEDIYFNIETEQFMSYSQFI